MPTPPGTSWWSSSVESTLAWTSLRPYRLLQSPLTSVIDVDDEADSVGLYADPWCASVYIPPHLRNTHAASSRGALDDRAEMTALISRFLKYIHAKQPIVDPDVLYGQISVVEEEGLGWDERTCLLLIACALGGICMPYDHELLEEYSKPSIDPEQYLRSREYFDAARKRLGLVMGHASIIGAQCFFLTAGYYVTSFKPLASWRCLNNASLMCKDVLMKILGAPAMTQGALASVDKLDNSHRKLFWSCLKTEREVAVELGFEIASAQLVQYENLPLLLPELEPSWSPASDTLDGLASSPTQHEQSWLYYLTDISLRKLEIRIDSFFATQQTRHHEPTIEARESFYGDILATLADLDQQIMEHFTRLPDPITIETDESGHSPDDLREYLRLRMIIIRHTLSRPAIYLILHGELDGLPVLLRAQATEIANRALQINEYLVLHGLTTHRHPGTWLGIRYCARAALELFATAKSSIPDLKPSPSWEIGIRKLKTALKYWGAESADARMYLEWIARLESPPEPGDGVPTAALS
ncbi:Zcf27p [Fusarium falciforme]|uniref:Zcf27p n=1 Tax=Fusarium falciforme TaxID=195108 RepID=A0A9W8QV25_9HYPO|nr:Zcf27p [Fusarium falciforme]